MIDFLLMTSIVLVAIFLILLILVQRGRGGGLTGALGGMGGQSAFGTKAGDLFTKITIVTAIVWGLLCLLAVTYYNRSDAFDSSFGGAAPPEKQSTPGFPSGPAPTGGKLPSVPTSGGSKDITLPPAGGSPAGKSATPETPAPKAP